MYSSDKLVELWLEGDVHIYKRCNVLPRLDEHRFVNGFQGRSAAAFPSIYCKDRTKLSVLTGFSIIQKSLEFEKKQSTGGRWNLKRENFLRSATVSQQYRSTAVRKIMNCGMTKAEFVEKKIRMEERSIFARIVAVLGFVSMT